MFKYEENEHSVTKCKDEMWFRGKTIVEILGYSNPLKAICTHIDSEDKRELLELGYKGGAQNGHPFRNVQRSAMYINESGLYSLILRSKLELACNFKLWVMKDVLPSIRWTGKYDYGMNHKYNEMLTFKIVNEMDLHVKVVFFLKKRFPHSIFTPTLSKNQDTSKKRIESYKKGYLHGSTDLIINNLHKRYTGLATEFKNPDSKGILSYDQSKMLQQYQNNCFKTIVTNDYNYVIEQLIEYFRDIRINCSYCARNLSALCQLKTKLKAFIKLLKEIRPYM